MLVYVYRSSSCYVNFVCPGWAVLSMLFLNLSLVNEEFRGHGVVPGIWLAGTLYGILEFLSFR